jgi:arabinosaccharide transport system substrate-binding protein
MSFHLGKPILAMIVISLASAAFVLTRPSPPRAQLVLWTFADSHANSYRGDASTPPGTSLVDRYAAKTGRSVQARLVNGNALNLRLTAMFDRRDVDPNQPDIAEIEIGSVGRFFRPPVNEVGFLPLNDLLEKSGWRHRIVEARLAPWTKEGVIFGFPHDLHPVSITYRKDLFDQAGIDLASAKTWPQFHEMCLAFQSYWHQRGYPLRHAMQMSVTTADDLTVMLLQRHINVLDDRNQIHLSNPKVADTILFYAQLVAGPGKIATDSTPGGQMWARDVANGDLCGMITPDWRAGYLPHNAPDAAGKLAMMPLPRFDSDDAPTATWGGTMAGIPRRCKDPQAAWNLLTFLYSSHQGVEARWRQTMILPPVIDLWDEPIFHQPSPYFSGQKVGELYIDLAKQMPRRYVTPFTAIATAQLSTVLNRVVDQINDGVDPESLRPHVQRWLEAEAIDLKRRIDFGKFED